MSQFGAFQIAATSVLCAFMLAACAPIQSSSTTSAAVGQTFPPASPNITALEQAQKGGLKMPAFVEFYSDDCAICRRIQGPMRSLDLEYDGRIRFIYIDIDLPDSQPFVRAYNVRGIPTFVLLSRNGDRRQSVPGWPGEGAVAESLKGLLSQP